MEQEINDIIKKNLPAQVGEQLKKRLELCDKLEGESVSREEKIVRLTGQKESLQTLVNDYHRLDEEIKTIKSREEAVLLKEKLLELKEGYASNRVDDAKSFISLVFNNHVLHKTLLNSTSTPVAINDPSGYGHVEQHQTSEEITETRDME